jgi:hypothetical protein
MLNYPDMTLTLIDLDRQAQVIEIGRSCPTFLFINGFIHS